MCAMSTANASSSSASAPSNAAPLPQSAVAAPVQAQPAAAPANGAANKGKEFGAIVNAFVAPLQNDVPLKRFLQEAGVGCACLERFVYVLLFFFVHSHLKVYEFVVHILGCQGGGDKVYYSALQAIMLLSLFHLMMVALYSRSVGRCRTISPPPPLKVFDQRLVQLFYNLFSGGFFVPPHSLPHSLSIYHPNPQRQGGGVLPWRSRPFKEA